MVVDYTGVQTNKGTRMMHLGLVSLLSRKGVHTKRGSSGPEGRSIPYIFRKVGKKKGTPNSFRFQPQSFANQGEDPEYMKLRTFSKAVWDQDAPGNSYQQKTLKDGRKKMYKRNETDGQGKARRLWMGSRPGERMQGYKIAGIMEGAEEMMERTKLKFKAAGMETAMYALTKQMMTSFIDVISQAGTWRETVGKRNYEGTGGGLVGLKKGKWQRRGLPIIGADSVEESQLYILDKASKKMIAAALAGKEFDINTGIRLAGGLEAKVKSPTSTMLDIQKEAHSNVYNKIIEHILQKDVEGSVHYGEEANRRYLDKIRNIAGFDVGEQPLEVRFQTQWDAYKSIENIKAITNYKQLEGFVKYLNQDAGKYKVSKAPRGKDATTEYDRGKTGQFARRLQETKRSYIFTQPLSSGGRMIMFVIKQNDIPTFVPMYIEGSNEDLGTTIAREMLGNNSADRYKTQIKNISNNEFAIFNNTALKVTHSISESFLHEQERRMGEVSTTFTMATPTHLNKWLRIWVGEAAEEWFSSKSWDNVFDPTSMRGSKFAQWFQLWIGKSRELEMKLDDGTGYSGWKAWLQRNVEPNYKKQGGSAPAGTKRSGMMQPGDPEPRTWHSPLYVRPYFVQDNLGKKQQIASNQGAYQDYKETQAYYEKGWRGFRT